MTFFENRELPAKVGAVPSAVYLLQSCLCCYVHYHQHHHQLDCFWCCSFSIWCKNKN